jgi:uncharacterized protein (TIGR02594 family)
MASVLLAASAIVLAQSAPGVAKPSHRYKAASATNVFMIGGGNFGSFEQSPRAYRRQGRGSRSAHRRARMAAYGRDAGSYAQAYAFAPFWNTEQASVPTKRQRRELRRVSVVERQVRSRRVTASTRTGTTSIASFGGGSDLVSEARRYIGTNPTHRRSLWCGTFMNMVLERTGRRGSGSDLARSFAGYGRRVAGPQVGAIAVMSRRGGGHVGIVSGIDAQGNPIVISGNHGRRVAESTYSRARVYAYVLPPGA